jgi:hypothetical protein
MRTATPQSQAEQVRHLADNLVSQFTKGREWATPEVEATLQKVVAGLDAGIESASPRIQAGLRRLADELAGGVETLAPRVHEGRKRGALKFVPAGKAPRAAKSRRTASGKAWLIAGAVAVAVTAAVAVWFSFRPADDKPAPFVKVQRTGANPDADTAPAEAQT